MRGKHRALVIDGFSSGYAYFDLLEERGVNAIHVVSNRLLLESYALPEEVLRRTYVARDADDALAYAVSCDVDFHFAGSEPGVELLGRIVSDPSSRSYNVPSLGAARTNKFHMNNTLKLAGYSCIPHAISDDANLAVAFWEIYGPDIVAKPVDSAGSDGVFYCSTSHDVHSAFSALLGRNNALGRVMNSVYIQQKIDGQNYVVNGLSSNGRFLITDVWIDHREISSTVQSLDYEVMVNRESRDFVEVTAFCKHIPALLGIRNGPFHIELIRAGGQFYFLEIGARLMGSVSHQAYKKFLGYSLAEAHVDQVIYGNMPLSNRDGENKQTRCVTVRSPIDGRVSHDLKSIFKGLRTFAGCYGVKPVGAPVRKWKTLFDNVATVYLHGSLQDVERDFRELREAERSVFAGLEEGV